MTGGPTFGWALAAVLIVLVLMALAAARIGRLQVSREIVVAAVRAIVQLAAVSTIIALVLERVWSSLLFVVAMFAIAVWVATGRARARADWMWVALALAAGALPVLATIFLIGAATFTGPAIIPIAGIVIGNSMTAHTLAARRAFDQLRDGVGQVEAGLSLGLPRRSAIDIVVHRHAQEALFPVLDQTRTVGLVTLPGAFIGVLLGGGSAADAAAAQILVLIGLIAAQTIVVGVAYELIARGRILAADVRTQMPLA